MEKKTCYSPSLPSPTQTDDDVPPNRLIEIANSFPDNLIIRLFVAPLARHFWKTVLAYNVLLFGSLITCNVWGTDEKVCDFRLHSLQFFTACGFMMLMGYTAHLQKKLERQKRLVQEA